MSYSAPVIVSKCTVHCHNGSDADLHRNSTIKTLKLSVSDLPMLSCHYIQKGVLLPSPPLSSADLIPLLKLSLSKTLSHFQPLSGRLHTDASGHVYIDCNDSGVEFVHATAPHLSTADLIHNSDRDIPLEFHQFFQFDRTLSYAGHDKPLAVVQVTELNDAVFIGITMNHAVVDGTSFWNFFNTFAEITKGVDKISKSPDFSRETVFNSPVVLAVPDGGPTATFSVEAPLREKIFHFSRAAILNLKIRANNNFEVMGKQSNDDSKKSVTSNGNLTHHNRTVQISSFQSLCAHLWRSVTRARNLDSNKTTTFRMAVNCRHRVIPPMHPLYFGNAIQSIPTTAKVGELLSNGLGWSAGRLHENVAAHGDATVRRGVAEWESDPKLFPLGNFDGAMITMGSSPRFPMYENDFGWGRPVAVRSGGANKFDGKISAFPGAEGDGSVDLEVVLSPETMAAIQTDSEFMEFVS